MKNRKLEDVFPISKIENDIILAKTGSITLAYRVELPEIFTSSIDDFEAIHAVLNRAIRVLPANTVIHKQDWFLEAKFIPKGESEPFLSRSSDTHFFERPYLDHECYLFISNIPSSLINPSPSLSSLIKSSIVPASCLDETANNNFIDKVEQFISILQESGYLTIRRLSGNEIASTEDNPGLLERYTYLLGADEYSCLADLSARNLKIGDRQLSIFSLSDAEELPAACGPRINYDKYSSEKSKFSVCFASPLSLLLNVNHIYNQYIFISDQQQTITKLEAKKKRLQSLSAYSRSNATSRDAANAFLQEMVGHGRLAIQAHFNIITWNDNPEKAREIKNMVTAAMSNLDARPKIETAAAATIFWAGIPGNAAELPNTSRFTSLVEQATCFFNCETNYRTSLSTTGIRFGDRLTGMPLSVDLFQKPFEQNIIQNRNMFILGPSGSGKSFATNHILRSCWETGAHVLVVDVGHSYQGLCSLAKGYYFSFTETNPIKFNPFFVPGNILDTEKKESIKSLLLALWKKDDETYSRSEYVTLSNALQSYYNYLRENPNTFPCFNTFYDFLQDIFLPDLRRQGVSEKNFDVDNFLYVLRPFYEGGEYDYLLNATENLNLLETNFIVFELDNIKDSQLLFTTTTLIISQLFIEKMRKLKGVRKIILIEEAWKAIAKAGMAEYIRYLFKTIRKFSGTAAVVTQEVNDIISSPIVKDTIIANSDIKVLLDQSKYQNKFSAISDLLGLTEKDRSLIMSMNRGNDPQYKYKEIFIGLGAYSKVYRTEVSLEEYLCYSTEEREKVMVQDYAAKYGSLKRGIAKLANELRTKVA